MLEDRYSEPEVVHRLKNYLSIIVGYCDVLTAEWPDNDPRRDDLLEISKAASAAMAMMAEVIERVR